MKGNHTSESSLMAWIEWLIRIAIGIMFSYAGWMKMQDPSGFARIIYGYGLFPSFAINAAAILVPALELVCGVCLILGVVPRAAAWVINFLLAAFICAVSINLLRGHSFDCGCFGNGTGTGSHLLLLGRDIVTFICGVRVMRYSGTRKLCFLQTGGWGRMIGQRML